MQARLFSHSSPREFERMRKPHVRRGIAALRAEVEELSFSTFIPNALTLLGLWSAGKVPCLLNYSTGAATMLACAQLAGLRQVISSRAFLERGKLNVEPLIKAGLDFLYLEDIRRDIKAGAKLIGALRARFALDGLLTSAATARVRRWCCSRADRKACPKASS